MAIAYLLAALDPPLDGDDRSSAGLRARRAAPVRSEEREGHERVLLARLRESDVAAFEEVYRHLYSDLLRFAYGYLRARHVAEEYVQDVFLDLWRRRETADIRLGLSPYLYAAVRNRVLRHRTQDARAMQVEARAIALGDGFAAGTPAPDQSVTLEQRELQKAVQQAVATLPEARRTILVLRWTRGMSYPEIAAVMGTTEDAARMQAKRAQRQLGELLQQFGEDFAALGD